MFCFSNILPIFLIIFAAFIEPLFLIATNEIIFFHSTVLTNWHLATVLRKGMLFAKFFCSQLNTMEIILVKYSFYLITPNSRNTWLSEPNLIVFGNDKSVFPLKVAPSSSSSDIGNGPDEHGACTGPYSTLSLPKITISSECRFILLILI